MTGGQLHGSLGRSPTGHPRGSNTWITAQNHWLVHQTHTVCTVWDVLGDLCPIIVQPAAYHWSEQACTPWHPTCMKAAIQMMYRSALRVNQAWYYLFTIIHIFSRRSFFKWEVRLIVWASWMLFLTLILLIHKTNGTHKWCVVIINSQSEISIHSWYGQRTVKTDPDWFLKVTPHHWCFCHVTTK